MYNLGANDAFLILASDGLWDVVDEAQVRPARQLDDCTRLSPDY